MVSFVSFVSFVVGRCRDDELKSGLGSTGEQIVTCERCDRLRTYCARIAREKRRAYRDEIY